MLVASKPPDDMAYLTDATAKFVFVAFDVV